MTLFLSALRHESTRLAFVEALPDIRDASLPWVEERLWLQRVVQYAAGRCSFREAADLLRMRRTV